MDINIDKALSKEKLLLELYTLEELQHLRQSDKNSQQYYLEIQKVVDTAYEDGRLKGKIEGIIEEKVGIARNLKRMGLSVKIISEATALRQTLIEKL